MIRWRKCVYKPLAAQAAPSQDRAHTAWKRLVPAWLRSWPPGAKRRTERFDPADALYDDCI